MNQYDYVITKPPLDEDTLAHYGVKGMKWHKHLKRKIANFLDRKNNKARSNRLNSRRAVQRDRDYQRMIDEAYQKGELRQDTYDTIVGSMALLGRNKGSLRWVDDYMPKQYSKYKFKTAEGYDDIHALLKSEKRRSENIESNPKGRKTYRYIDPETEGNKYYKKKYK